MIFDTLDNAALYEGALPHLKQAFAFARTLNAQTPDGHVDLPGGLYANVMSGTTKPAGEGLFETHEKHLDLQVLISGREVFEVAPLSALKNTIPYDPEKDAAFSEGSYVLRALAEPGTFYLLAPNDAHRACLYTDEPGPFKKAVVKIPIE